MKDALQSTNKSTLCDHFDSIDVELLLLLEMVDIHLLLNNTVLIEKKHISNLFIYSDKFFHQID